MTTVPGLDEIRRHVCDLIANAPAGSASTFDSLALLLFRFQYHANAPYRAFCDARGRNPATVASFRDIPAIVSTAFKDFELTVLPPEERTVTFHSSGTTQHRHARHFHSAETLKVYEASLLRWFKPFVLPDLEKARFIILTPEPSQAPHSSLVHMFGAVTDAFATSREFFAQAAPDGSWEIRSAALLARLESVREPVVLCGTAFSFVHFCDYLDSVQRRLHLPEGSRIFETGGYKGRSRTVSKPELHGTIRRCAGVPETHIVSEYGMSELSSQAYDRAVGSNAPREFQFPPWARAVIISPETGREVAPGERGLIRVFDLANVGSVMAVQTEDSGIRRENGFELAGRASEAEARGCSLMHLEP
jgi:hypothetical protein